MQLSRRKRLRSVAIVWCGFVVADAADLTKVAGVCCPHLLAKEQTTTLFQHEIQHTGGVRRSVRDLQHVSQSLCGMD